MCNKTHGGMRVKAIPLDSKLSNFSGKIKNFNSRFALRRKVIRAIKTSLIHPLETLPAHSHQFKPKRFTYTFQKDEKNSLNKQSYGKALIALTSPQFNTPLVNDAHFREKDDIVLFYALAVWR